LAATHSTHTTVITTTTTTTHNNHNNDFIDTALTTGGTTILTTTNNPISTTLYVTPTTILPTSSLGDNQESTINSNNNDNINDNNNNSDNNNFKEKNINKSSKSEYEKQHEQHTAEQQQHQLEQQRDHDNNNQNGNNNNNNNNNFDKVLLTPQNRYKSTLPKVIITASASVSDGTGRKLNYSVGNVLGTGSRIKIPPPTYDDYKEDDVLLDPFFLDVPKIKPRIKRSFEKKSSHKQQNYTKIELLKKSKPTSSTKTFKKINTYPKISIHKSGKQHVTLNRKRRRRSIVPPQLL